MLLQEVDEHRTLINGITSLAEADITSYASTVIGEAPERAAAQLRVAGGAVISQYGELAAVSGALFYENARPKPGFTADLAPVAVGDQVAGALGWAFLPMFRPDQFPDGPVEALPRLAAVVQKFVATADRDTIRAAGKRDSLSTGVQSYARASACSFCALLSAQSVRGGHWHNNCRCVEVPSWRDAPAPESEVRAAQSAAVKGAIKQIEDARYSHPDWQRMAPRYFLKAHPEFVLSNKNITRVMRESYGFAH
jgi:hypothetical protein